MNDKRQRELNLVPHNGVETSIEAAESMVDHVGRLERRVLDAIGRSLSGMTCDETEITCGLSHQCASARINQLMNRGRIVDSGERRPTRSGRRAIVWKVTP